jgi:putative hemolysin
MSLIDLDKIIDDRCGKDFLIKHKLLRKLIIYILGHILYIETINSFMESNSHYDSRQFINTVFEKLNFSYLISSSDLQKIPAEGKVICVANHPIGSLDGISLLKIMLDLRPDVKIITNDVLLNIDNLSEHFLPIKLDSRRAQCGNVNSIGEALVNECAVIMFPAAKVSRLKWFRITDSKWNKGAVYFARKFNSPVLPVFIGAKNSTLFYAVSIISKRLSMLLLAHELFNKKNRTMTVRIGDLIPARSFSSSFVTDSYQIKLLKKHLYRIGRKKKGVFITEKNVIHPVDRKLIKKELNDAPLIGFTKEGLKIYLTTKVESPQTLNEIARLREITFRHVGEGTGGKLDLDKYDSGYQHLIVWNDDELDIVGAYRIGHGESIMANSGIAGFYTSSLFDYSEDFTLSYIPESIELGRSFVQKKYWNTNALNYLWQGIGTYLTRYPEVRYMFGGVSISNNYPDHVKCLITYYFDKWYGDRENLAKSKRKFSIPEEIKTGLGLLLRTDNPKEDYKILKNMIKPLGYSIPVLYKHYADLCDPKGVRFLDFGVDASFENCVDGLILVDVKMIKEEKKQKFIRPSYSEKIMVPV